MGGEARLCQACVPRLDRNAVKWLAKTGTTGTNVGLGVEKRTCPDNVEMCLCLHNNMIDIKNKTKKRFNLQSGSLVENTTCVGCCTLSVALLPPNPPRPIYQRYSPPLLRFTFSP